MGAGMPPSLRERGAIPCTPLSYRDQSTIKYRDPSQGVESLLIKCAVEEQLAKLTIPREAVRIEEVPAVEFESSVQDRHRPLVGGLQATLRRVALGITSTAVCTESFNAIRAGVPGFVTNSHCTFSRGLVDPAVTHQATVSGTTNQVGIETVDPPYVPGVAGGVCPVGKRCRWSDSAFIRRATGVTATLGRVARPILGTTAWNGVDTFRIVGDAMPWMGLAVTKVGRSTGRTQGTVTSACTNIDFPGTNIRLLCQAQATYASAEGDSGAPVFRVRNTPSVSDVILYGVHFGSGGSGASFRASFSPMDQVQFTGELGGLVTCASGFSC